eukprot:Plantae.Rhodophyta-Purpureofilum_apyrenoidigerum.ctg2470.p1 GENE.Plantae.Rhodophyta-Purpureofilum_apyrenoidigerum.ctg2470~~Plantae.Rhodophyta-Purpureofilum_apyrenoidigerum.ctg2470.p1  ORF type:complete len:539 (+),score=62.44 Plantae.Rhodophyta-Purpureofilum_apyrenoidigerum.ctg2470:78-1619(+)
MTPSQPTLGGGASFSASSMGSGFSFSNTGVQSGQKTAMNPSFSTNGQLGGGFGGGGLFSGQSASPGLASTGFSLGGTTTPTAPSTSLFNTTLGAQSTQPLQANIASAPYGTYPLFAQTASNPAQPGGVQLAAASVSSAIGSASAAASSTAASPSMYRRTPRSTAKVRPRSFIPRTGTLGSGSSVSSLFGSTSGTPTFTSNLFMNGSEDSPWKSIQKTGDERASSVKKLVIEPLAQTPAKSISRTLVLSENRNGLNLSASTNRHQNANVTTPSRDEQRSPSHPQTPSHQRTSISEERQNGKSGQEHTGMESITYRPTPKRNTESNPMRRVDQNGFQSGIDNTVEDIGTQNGNGQNAEDRGASAGSNNIGPPVLTKKDYYAVPSINELRKLDDNQLRNVKNFTVGRKGVGEVQWTGSTDVRGVDLDTVVHFSPKVVVVYPDEADKPATGQGLNKSAEVCLEGVWKIDKATKRPMKDADSIASMDAKLRKHCRNEGLEFIEYDGHKGTWRFIVPHF